MTAPYTIARFGGLNLKSAPDEVGVTGAINGINFDLDSPGTVRTRDGVDLLATQASTTLSNLYGADGTTDRLLASVVDGATAQCEARNTAGAVTGSVNLTTGGTQYFVSWGDPAGEAVYFTDTGTTIRKYVPSTDTFSQPASQPSGVKYLAVQPNDNRLVACGKGGTSEGDSPSTVQFSEQRDPETWPVNNYVELTPGDGDVITGACVWRNYLYVFKRTKFFVFYGNSIDQSGDPVFNYRAVDTGIGLEHPMAVATAPEGIYFVGRDGVYLTSGDTPYKVSDAIDPIFNVGTAPDWDYGTIGSSSRLQYFDGRLHVAYTASGSSPRCLVFDPQTRDWMAWRIPDTASTTLNGLAVIGSTLYFGTNTTALNIYTLGSDTDDNGGNISSSYQFGRYSLEQPGVEKRVMRSRIWGHGTVTFKSARNWGDLSTGQAVTLGVAPAIADAMVDDESGLGFVYSCEISDTAGAWKVHSITHEVDAPARTQTRTT